MIRTTSEAALGTAGRGERTRAPTALAGVVLGLGLLAMSPSALAVTIFSEGMTTPESISEAPASFGALAGDFLIPDASAGLPTSTVPEQRHGRIWRVPAAGGAPSVFADLQDVRTLGGLFLPESAQWGASAGHYLVAGFGPPTVDQPKLLTAGPDGMFSTFVTFPENGLFLSSVVLAPDDFGVLGGNLLVSAQSSGIRSVAPDGSIGTLVAADPARSFFGLAFAPSGFGTVGGKLLASIGSSGDIWAVDADGSLSLFATVDLLTSNGGGRQMVFAPSGYLGTLGLDEDLLLISLSDRGTGGGTLGDVLAVNGLGETVASLRVVDDLTKFDPRGLLVSSTGVLLVSDTSDPIISATAADFRPGRFANAELLTEPLSLALVVFALAPAVARRRC